MAYRWLGVVALLAACSFGCESSGAGGPRGDGGVGGSGGDGGTGGEGGTGSSQIPCDTSALCLTCPDGLQCDTNQDCAAGYLCIESGCDDLDGAPITQCVFAGGSFCTNDADCSPDRRCIDVPGESPRCIKTTPGCSENDDCVLGFSCEGGQCVDRRVPCILDADCPKSHFCHRFDATGFCLRVNQGCGNQYDCIGPASACVDIDGDDETECAGVFNPNLPPHEPCLNSMCSGSTPVCEVGYASGSTDCGQYGLCNADEDCDESNGFECVGLWLDGRSECVLTGGSCSHITDCLPRQVCASPRDGGAPSCQVGYQP